ncbi:LysM peptidoglycan-binding domain-containing protein [Microbacterium oleivorans]|uniref:LysM domain-containing protein n=1 Tax=Microbacterium oleivorans TaxID=273677 RepID=A0A177K957_9MICO|nr:LysM domain-containing protein [Microbacterium oleivorans]OAH49694.1 hypothetical protein AYL44_08825 [Microbacterium oleivorans]
MRNRANLASVLVTGLLAVPLAGCTFDTAQTAAPDPSRTMGTVPPPTSAQPKPLRPAGPVPTGLDDAPTNYVIVEGDTAWGISRTFGIPITRIPNGWLHPGDILDLTVDHSFQWREYLDSTN